MAPPTRNHRRERFPINGNLVVSISFLAVVTAAMTIPLMTWRITGSLGATIFVLNVVVLALITLWVIWFT